MIFSKLKPNKQGSLKTQVSGLFFTILSYEAERKLFKEFKRGNIGNKGKGPISKSVCQEKKAR